MQCHAVLAALALLAAAQIAAGQETTRSCTRVRGDLLGFDAVTRNPVYEQRCSGSCVSIINAPTTCQPKTYTYRSILVRPLWYAGTEYKTLLGPQVPFIPYTKKTVKIISECSCKPKQCTVNGRVYNHNAIVYNSCGEKCRCIYGEVKNCCRLRKSFVHMSNTERLRYTQAVYDVSRGTGAATPALKAEYDAMIKDHADNFNAGIHAAGELLPWHRLYILQMENLLRKVDCRITVPYWAWELDHANPWGSNMWSPVNGFGGGNSGQCVPDGPFTINQPNPFYMTPSTGTNQCLRRNRSGSVPSPTDVATMLATPASQFNTFHSYLNGFHGGVHCAVGATMCQHISSNAPEFFLHHCNMDRLWAKWQAQSVAHREAFGPDLYTVMTPSSDVSGGYRPVDLLNITDHLGVCVQYVEPLTVVIGAIDILHKLPQAALLATSVQYPFYLAQARHWNRMHKMREEDIKGQPDDESVFEILEGRPTPAPEYEDDSTVRTYGAYLDDLLNNMDELTLDPTAMKEVGLNAAAVRTFIAQLQDTYDREDYVPDRPRPCNTY